MNRFVLSALLMIIFISALKPQSSGGRKPAEVRLIHADMALPMAGNRDAMRVIGNVQLEHEGVRMACDSAHRHLNSNIIHAFGNVHINQGDTLHLYGDMITYYGNRRYAEVRRNVRLVDSETTLTTEYLDFNLEENYGYFPNRAVVINADNRLESIKGYYYTEDKTFFFQDSVHITNPDYIINSDALRYNTVTEVAYFMGPTTITGDDIDIYCENGWYDTQNDIAQFNENARVKNNTQVVIADSLFYNNRQGIGEAFRNIEINDSIENFSIKGDYAWFTRDPEHMFVTGRALFIQMAENDTLYLHADTLYSWLEITDPAAPPPLPEVDEDSRGESDTTGIMPAGQPPPAEVNQVPGTTSRGNHVPEDTADVENHLFAADTTGRGNHVPPDTAIRENHIPAGLAPLHPADTARVMAAYYGAKFFSNDMQGKSDSIFYNMRDSVIHMFSGPVLWSGESQLTSEYMEIHSKNGKADHLVMNNRAFIVSEEEPELFNQIKGNKITGFFREGELYRVNVSGNAETLYYPTDNDGIIGITKAVSSNLVIFLKENKPDVIRFLTNPDMTLYPLEDLPANERLLQDFQWLDHIRPKTRQDVFDRN